jgi:hypothetical protein
MAEKKSDKKNTGHGPGKVLKPGNVCPSSWWKGTGSKKTKK